MRRPRFWARSIPLGLCAWLLSAGAGLPVARAAVPSETSYQGVLTDDAGDLVPDGAYALTFRIYDAPTGGVRLWLETQAAVPVSRGGFSVRLGSVTPLTLDFDQPCWMSVSINAGPELAPRVALSPVPQALSLRLPFAASVNTPLNLLRLSNASGTGGGMWIDPNVLAGGMGHDGWVGVTSAAPSFVTSMLAHAPAGGQVFTSAPNGDPQASIYPITGGGCGIDVRGPANTHQAYMEVDNQAYPKLVLDAFTSYAALDMSQTGSASVDLPENAIESYEILDEPGIAQEHFNGRIDLPANGVFGDLMSVTITTPEWGYITLHADGMHGLGSNGASANETNFTLKETPGGAIDNNYWLVSGWSSTMPSGLHRQAYSQRRTWYKPPGTYTFYFQGLANNPGGLANYLWDPTLTATYTPASYGAVHLAADRGEAAKDGLAALNRPSPPGEGGERIAADAVTVDVRELEVRARKLRREARAAEQALRLARHASGAAPRAALKLPVTR